MLFVVAASDCCHYKVLVCSCRSGCVVARVQTAPKTLLLQMKKKTKQKQYKKTNNNWYYLSVCHSEIIKSDVCIYMFWLQWVRRAQWVCWRAEYSVLYKNDYILDIYIKNEEQIINSFMFLQANFPVCKCTIHKIRPLKHFFFFLKVLKQIIIKEANIHMHRMRNNTLRTDAFRRKLYLSYWLNKQKHCTFALLNGLLLLLVFAWFFFSHMYILHYALVTYSVHNFRF